MRGVARCEVAVGGTLCRMKKVVVGLLLIAVSWVGMVALWSELHHRGAYR